MSGWDAWSRSNEATTICSGCAIHHKFPFSGMSMPTPPHRKRSKKLRPLVQEVATAFPEAQVELWATDEHRIGLKPILRRVWAPKGHLPIAPVQPRYEWRYLVGFVHPASGRTIFHHATSVSIPLFEAELAAFARQVGVSPKKKMVLVLGRAGSCWIVSDGTPVCACVHPTTSIRTSSRPTPPNCSPPNISWTLGR